MAKVRVPIYNTPGKATTVDPEATKGAVVGVTLWLQDGTLVTEEMLFAADTDDEGELDFTYWKLIHEIPVNVVALAETATTGLYAITGAGTSATRTIEAAAGETTVANGDGVAGNPVVGLADVADAGGGAIRRFDRDAKGRVSGTSAATTDDLTEGSTNLYFTNARADARIDLQKGQPNGLAPLDAGAKLDGAFLPDLAITDTFVVASEAAMLALTAERGDVAVRTDLNQSFILTAEPASTLANWQELLTPTSPVTSVFGRVGAVVAQTGDYTFAQIGSKPTTLGGYGITDAVTSVGLSAPTGFTVSGSPVTGAGTLGLAFAAGYRLFTGDEGEKLDKLRISTEQIEGLIVSASGTTISVSAGLAYIQSVDRPVTFAGGTIASSPTANTTYHVYLHDDGTIIRSTVAPAAPSGATARFMSGDNSYRYLGSVRGNASANYVPQQADAGHNQVQVALVHNAGTDSRLVSGGTATTPTDVSAAAFAPAGPTNALRFRIQHAGTSAVLRYYCYNGSGFVINSNVPAAGIAVTDVVCDGTPKVQYDFSGAPGGSGAFMDLVGYSYAR